MKALTHNSYSRLPYSMVLIIWGGGGAHYYSSWEYYWLLCTQMFSRRTVPGFNFITIIIMRRFQRNSWTKEFEYFEKDSLSKLISLRKIYDSIRIYFELHHSKYFYLKIYFLKRQFLENQSTTTKKWVGYHWCTVCVPVASWLIVWSNYS